jgi:hypothetical protein
MKNKYLAAIFRTLQYICQLKPSAWPRQSCETIPLNKDGRTHNGQVHARWSISNLTAGQFWHLFTNTDKYSGIIIT